MNDPFAVAVGMVLQRNQTPYPHFGDGDAFLGSIGITDTRGKYFEVTGMWEGVVQLSPQGRPGDFLYIVPEHITAEWFIPD